MNGLQPNDFVDYHAYETHRDALEHVQKLGIRLFDVWNNLLDLVDYNTDTWYNMRRILEDVAQLGYEAALGIPHRTADYIDKWSLSTYPDACGFCNKSYVHHLEGEVGCNLEDNGKRCKLEVKEFLD